MARGREREREREREKERERERKSETFLNSVIRFRRAAAFQKFREFLHHSEDAGMCKLYS